MAAYPLDQNRVEQIGNASETALEQLTRIRSALQSPNSKITTLGELREAFQIDYNVEHPKDLSGLLVFLHASFNRNNIPIETLIASIDEGLQDWDVPADFISEWDRKKSIIAEISNTPVVRYISKKSELTYRHRSHIHDFRIISELRPVLNDDRKSISEFILLNRLHLIISDPSEHETYLEVPVGIDDLRRLHVEIEAALDKADVIQDDLSKAGKSYRTTLYSKRQR